MLNNFIVLLLILFPLGVFSNERTIVDSIHNIISNSINNFTIVNNYKKKKEESKLNNIDSIYLYAQYTLKLSKKNNYKRGVAYSIKYISQVYRVKNDFLLSLKYGYNALKLFEEIKDEYGIAEANYQLGFSYNTMYNSKKAEPYILKALEISKKINDSMLQIRCNTLLGAITLIKVKIDTNYFRKSIDYYNNALVTSLKILNNERIAIAYLNLSNAFLEFSTLCYNESYISMSIDYGLKGVQYSKLKNSVILEGMNYSNVADAYSEKKDYVNAQKYYYISRELILISENKLRLIETSVKLLKLYLTTNQFSKFLPLFEESRALAIKLNDKASLVTIYDYLSQYYLSIYQYNNAYKARLNYGLYKDSILKDERKIELSNLEVQYKINQKNIEISNLIIDKKLSSVKIEQDRTIRNFLIFSVLLILGLFVLFYNRYWIKINTNKLIEEKNRKLNKLSIVAQEARNGILITNQKGEIEWYNDEFALTHKQYFDQHINSINNIFKLLNNNSIKQIIQDIVKEGDFKEIEYNFEKEGEEIWLQNRITPIFNEKKEVYKIVFVETNITQLVKARKSAENALILQEQFLANTSHEIRTPMNGIIGMTQQLFTTKINAEQKEYLDAINESSFKLMQLINGILEVSKIKAGKIEFEAIPFKMLDIIQSIQLYYSVKAREKNLNFIIKIDETIPQILIGDPTRLIQILNNLISNALKFTESGSILLEINVNSNINNLCELKFIIEDTGIGISNDKIKYIFEAFSQAELETNRLFGGSGLGLNITKSLIEMQGGEINVVSTLNKGTTFEFSLNFIIGNSLDLNTVVKKYIKLPENIDLSYLKILMVEDNLINQKVALFLLNKWKVNTDVACNPIEAFKMLKTSTYHLILMDLSMPIMSGIEATVEIRKNVNESIRNIPIIALTASGFNKERLKCLEAGMNDYISKPLNAENLYSKLIKWTKND